MHVTLPDPHPGRCPNFRTYGPDMGSRIVHLRCLEREFPAHICRFPEPPRERNDWASGSYVWQRPEPKEWVPPVDGEVVSVTWEGREHHSHICQDLGLKVGSAAPSRVVMSGPEEDREITRVPLREVHEIHD